MNEEEFDSLMQSRPFGTKDALRADAQLRHNIALGIALWGRTPEDLKRQLLAPYPEIPANFDLADLRELQRSAWIIAKALEDSRNVQLSRLALSSATVVVGTQRFTAWEARCEIVRRAIEHLENR